MSPRSRSVRRMWGVAVVTAALGWGAWSAPARAGSPSSTSSTLQYTTGSFGVVAFPLLPPNWSSQDQDAVGGAPPSPTPAEVAGASVPPGSPTPPAADIGEPKRQPPPATPVSVDEVLVPPGQGPPSVSSTDVDPPRARRPRFSAAVGMGLSRDGTWRVAGDPITIPAFEALLGIGEGLLGFEARLFSSQAAGRYQPGVDRLAIDAMAAFHPFASPHGHLVPGRVIGWVDRTAQLFTVDVGLAAEHASAGQQAVWRPGLVLGTHVDLPLTPDVGSGELRLRLTARKMWGSNVNAGPVLVKNSSLELFAGLSVGF